MEPSLWIIDAYNLVRRDPRLRAQEEAHGGAAARTLLEAQLSLFRARKGRGHAVVLVYDGAPSGPVRQAERKGLRILHPRPGRSADDVVLAEARRAEGRFRVVVVTSDVHDIASRLRGLRVEHRSVEDFGPELWKGVRDDAGAEKPKEVGKDDVDYWLEQFGE